MFSQQVMGGTSQLLDIYSYGKCIKVKDIVFVRVYFLHSV